MKVDLILVSYRRDDTLAAIRFCVNAFPQGWIRRFILVMNNSALESSIAGEIGPEWEVLQGTNSLAEFSGWQEGLNHLGALSDGVVFVNDTVTTHRTLTLGRKLAMVRTFQECRGASIAGVLDRGHLEDFVIAGLMLDRWISTFCFMLTSDALRRLGYQLYDLQLVEDCVPGGTDEELFFYGLSINLTQHLRSWLFHGGWHASKPLSPENAETMAFKAKSIISEKYLSARCYRENITVREILDKNYSILSRLDNVEQHLICHAPRPYGYIHRQLRWT